MTILARAAQNCLPSPRHPREQFMLQNEKPQLLRDSLQWKVSISFESDDFPNKQIFRYTKLKIKRSSVNNCCYVVGMSNVFPFSPARYIQHLSFLFFFTYKKKITQFSFSMKWSCSLVCLASPGVPRCWKSSPFFSTPFPFSFYFIAFLFFSISPLTYLVILHPWLRVITALHCAVLSLIRVKSVHLRLLLPDLDSIHTNTYLAWLYFQGSEDWFGQKVICLNMSKRSCTNHCSPLMLSIRIPVFFFPFSFSVFMCVGAWYACPCIFVGVCGVYMHMSIYACRLSRLVLAIILHRFCILLKGH